MPVLISHFFEHKSFDKDATFMEFLTEHYSEHQNHTHRSGDTHDNLPFQANDCAASHISVVFDHQHQLAICEPSLVAENVIVDFELAIFTSAVFNKIWQPPQVS